MSQPLFTQTPNTLAVLADIINAGTYTITTAGMYTAGASGTKIFSITISQYATGPITTPGQLSGNWIWALWKATAGSGSGWRILKSIYIPPVSNLSSVGDLPCPEVLYDDWVLPASSSLYFMSALATPSTAPAGFALVSYTAGIVGEDY